MRLVHMSATDNRWLTQYKLNCNSLRWILKLLMLATFMFSSTLQTLCPTEYSDLTYYNATPKWKSKKHVQNQVVISRPPCVDEDNKLITRICVNGSWNPMTTPKCSRVIKNEVCPYNWKEMRDFCVFVTKPQAWLGNDYETLTTQQSKSFVGNASNKVWLPVKRIVKNGEFENVEIGDDYGKIFDTDISDYKVYFSGDCLTNDTKTGKITPENCTRLYPFVRYFHKDDSLYSCPENCHPSGLFDHRCYCKTYTGNCQNYANIDSVSNYKILERVASYEICRINGTSRNHNYYISGSSWEYGSYQSDCSICETPPLSTSPELTLSFEKKKRKLHLVIYSPETIKHHDDEYKVYCFTNADKKHLKKRVDIDLVYKHLHRNLPDSMVVFKIDLEKYMGEYWCEAFSTRRSLIKSNKIVAYSKKKGNEYSLRVVITHVCKTFSCNMGDFYEGFCNEKLKSVLKHLDPEIRIMEIFRFEIVEDVLDILLHISSKQQNNVKEEYFFTLEKLRNINNTCNLQIVYFRSSEFCLPDYTGLNSSTLSWPLTKIGSATVSEEFCLMQDGTPATRVCNGDFLYGAIWSEMLGNCDKNVRASNLTAFLIQLKQKPDLSTFDWKSIRGTKLSVIDIYYFDEILKVLPNFESQESKLFTLNFLSKLIATDYKTLSKAQEALNLTDMSLQLTDYALSQSVFNLESVFLFQQENLIVHIANPFLHNISGLLLYGERDDHLNELSVVDFTRGGNFENVNVDHLELAIYVPESILEQILNDTQNNVSEVAIVTTIFYNDSLFIDNHFKSDSYVISVTIPGYGTYLESPLSVIFRSNKVEDEMCGFWDDGKRSNLKKGKWSVLGSNYVGKFKENNLHHCSFTHLTHFALLIMSDRRIMEGNETITSSVSEAHTNHILNVITIIGGLFSAAGIAGIFLTAIVFEKWRQKVGTKILINLAVAILLETVCIHLSEIEYLKESKQSCKVIGSLLHYVVISKFCWMLIYAILQYFRFVKVLGSVPNNLMLKSIIFAWGLPLVLVLIAALATTGSYTSSSYELCYPRGLLLYLVVITPVFLITVANLGIFCIIMYNVIYPKAACCGDKNKDFKVRLYLGCLLFFMLGMPWIFGLLAEVTSFSILKMFLFGIFCVTGTIQGFVLFLFYVALNKETRNYWLQFLCTKKFLKNCKA